MTPPIALRLYRTAERPQVNLWLEDDNGTLIDFSTGYTFEFKIGLLGKAAVFTKSSGMTGAVGSGTEASGTPNFSTGFASGELDDIPAGIYWMQIRATTGTSDRFFQFLGEVVDVIL